MKISFITDEVTQSFDEAVRFARQNGLAGLELRSVEDTAIDMLPAETLRAWRRRLDAEGLTVCGLAGSFYKCALEPDAVEAELAKLERLCAAMQEKTGIHPKAPVSRTAETAASTETSSTLFTGDMLAQLHTVFSRMASPLVLRLYLDETPLSAELKQYMEELAAQSSKLTMETGAAGEMEHPPCVRVCRPDGSWTGLAFHGVPGGHEFTSFVLGLYNAAGPGQALDEDTRAAIQSIQKPIKLEILVSLSCTMCPDLVTAAQRIAAENPHITAQVYDLNHFPDLREKYQVMSVPCLVINDGEQVSFGKKNIRQLLELLT